MIKKIRKSVFETNSSSCHAICINTKKPVKIPKEIFFGVDEFGWEQKECWSVQKKCDYLNMAILDSCVREEEYAEYKDKIDKVLRENSVERIMWDLHPHFNKEYNHFEFGGYIDHSYELIEFIKDVTNDSDLLMKFLFGESVIITDNDNDDCEYLNARIPKYRENKGEWYIYEKGN